jgi:hypothetical protein
MQLQFADALELGKPRRTKEGYLAVRARSARTGVYDYSGHQVDPDNKHGLRDQATVKVLRDEATVFDKRAVQSFIGKPITVDHPHQPVTAANWKDHSRGAIMGALKDGEYLAFDLLLMDKAAIADVEAGKRELSNGYAAELEFGDFTAPCGTKCPVRQRQITDGNHVAIVDAGRAGQECRISDGGNTLFETCDAATVILNANDAFEEKPVKKIMIDGLQVDLSDASAVETAITKLQGQLTAADAAKATLEAKVTTLEKQVADAKLTPQQLRDAAAAYSKVVDQAKALGVAVTDGMDELAIQKAVVVAKVGDAAKDWNDAQIGASFSTLAKDVKSAGNTQPILTPTVASDMASIRDAARALRH